MNKTLSPTEVKELLKTTKLPVPPPTLSRRERMMIWAAAVEAYPRRLSMFHGIEYHHPSQWDRLVDTICGTTIFDVSHREPRLAEAGLSSNKITENMEFFQLSPDELHYLSCDCHGEVSNRMVADRITTLASMRPGEYHGCGVVTATVTVVNLA